MKYDSSNRETAVLTGLLVPAQWDKNGDATGLALSCQDENEYILLMDKVGKRLFSYIHKEVIIKGISLKEDCKEVFKVISYQER